jgi:hypothetical protein
MTMTIARRSIHAFTSATPRTQGLIQRPLAVTSRPFFSAVLNNNKTVNKDIQPVSYGQPTAVTHPELMKKGEGK